MTLFWPTYRGRPSPGRHQAELAADAVAAVREGALREAARIAALSPPVADRAVRAVRVRGRVSSSVAANVDIRRVCEVAAVWTPERLAVLARLRAEWQAAVAREAESAA